MERAIRRLGVLEQLFLLLAAAGALVAGALVAWLLGQAFDLPFRPTWAISALTLFVVPAAISFWGVRRGERTHNTTHRDEHGSDAGPARGD